MYETLLAEKLTNAIQNEAMELSEQPLAVKNVEHWPVSQRMIVEMGDYAWSEHIVTIFLACQITIKNVKVQLTVKGKTTPDSYTPMPKSSSDQNVSWCTSW
jgi:hypothetical protein